MLNFYRMTLNINTHVNQRHGNNVFSLQQLNAIISWSIIQSKVLCA